MKDFTTPTRVWINAPSKLQPFNPFHGMVGIAHTTNNITTIYFATGSCTSIQINKSCLETKNSQANVFNIQDKFDGFKN